MTEMSETVYENHLKGEYAVENGEDSLIITSSSCYRMKEETLSLIDNLPKEGGKDFFLKAMSEMGIEKAEAIFDRLLAIDALRPARKKPVRKLLLSLIRPDLRLIPAAWQEKFFRAARLAPVPGRLGRNSGGIFFLAAAGVLAGLVVSYSGIYPELAKISSGRPQTFQMLALVLLGSVIHELGHSWSAAAAGIGFRPVGFSVYLFYPVFYTNVSGMEKLSAKEKTAIDLGGFFTQSAYLILLLGLWYLTKNLLFLETVRWMSLIMLFNLNPFLRTDGYWLYKDARKGFGDNKYARRLHYLYLAAFALFSLYLFRYLYLRVGSIYALLVSVWAEPSVLLSEGYKIVLGFYMLIMFFMGGARRLEETRQEWLELKRQKA